MRWVRLFDPPPPNTGSRFTNVMMVELDDHIRGMVIDEAPAFIRLASDQHVGMFVRRALPREAKE
jgi:hypothetical protein